MSAKAAGAIVILLCLLQCPSFAADDTSAKGRTRQTLLYGIDSQVLDAIQAIKTAKDTSFTPELTRALNENASPDIQAAVFDLFREQNIRDGEERGKTHSRGLAGNEGLPAHPGDPVPGIHP